MLMKLYFIFYTFAYIFRNVHSQHCSVFPERPLGMTDKFNGIKDNQIKASSVYSDDTKPIYARLHYSDAFLWDPNLPGSGSWVAGIQNTKQFIEVDLLERKVVTSIATQGRQGSREYVTDYYVEYSDGDVPNFWTLYRDRYGKSFLFDGNENDNTVKINNLKHPIVARHVRIMPQRWHETISLRFELFGCTYFPWAATFDGKSRIDFRLDLPGHAIQTAEDVIKFRFRTRQSNGIILYADGGQGDHFIVEMYRSRLRVKVNLGNTMGTAPEKMDNVMDAGSMLDNDQWHDVKIVRKQKDVNVTLDRIEMWRNITADFIHLNLNRNVSIGGVGNFAGKRGLSIFDNFVGCIEEFVFDGVNMIRDSRRLLQLDKNKDISWQIVLKYPSMSPVIWWGDQLTEGQLGLANFATVGAVGSECVGVSSSGGEIITFPDTGTMNSFGRVEREGLTTLTFSVNFRTFNRDGTLFFYFADKEYTKRIYLGINKGTGYLEFEMSLDGVMPVSYSIRNQDQTADSSSFADGMWHSVKLALDVNQIIITADNMEYKTVQFFTQPLTLEKTYYIGGGKPSSNSFQGCLRNIILNNVMIPYSPQVFDASVRNGTCNIIDRCTPNPCKHEAPCTQDGSTFYCNCTLTGYSGQVCHQSQHPTSCSEVSLRTTSIKQMETTIDLDASGVLPPFKVLCDFSTSNAVITELKHNHDSKQVLVENHAGAGSYKLALDYSATREALNELTRRASYCEQTISYKCFNAKLFETPPNGGTSRYNQAYGWWVGRRGQQLYYWGGGIPGLKMCQCGVTGSCAGGSRTCNCDSDASTASTSQTDQGLFTDKNDLPVMAVHLGDTSTKVEGRYSYIEVGSLRCTGDSLFDNTLTFTKPDSVIELPPLFSENEFDMIFLFRTTVLNAVIMQNANNGKLQQFFEVRIREGYNLRVAFDIGQGVQILEVHTANWLNDNSWHKVQFERNRKESRLIVDENLPIVLHEDPDRPFTAFNFNTSLYVGSTQAFTDGYMGCFSNLIINGRVMNLIAAISDEYGIRRGCKPRCDEKPCLNRGECYEMYSHYYCECGLTPYRGFVCGRVVGAQFIDGAAVKIELDVGQDRVGTMEEYIEIGFKTKGKQGTLIQVSNNDNSEYITLSVNNNGGVSMDISVGFQRYEIPIPYKNMDFTTDQHHTLKVWRSKIGQQLNFQIDDYDIQNHYFNFLSDSSDTRLDNPKFIYVGRNFSEASSRGFVGCIYRMQFNNIFPLKMLFNTEKKYKIHIQGSQDHIRENNCGYEEVMPRPEKIEFKQYPPIPVMNVTETLPDWQRQSIIVGVVLGIILLVLVILLVFFLRNYTVERGDYDTREARGADQMDTADNAIRYGKSGQPDVASKEWWI